MFCLLVQKCLSHCSDIKLLFISFPGQLPYCTLSLRAVEYPAALSQSGPVEPIESLLEARHPFFIPTKVQTSRTSPSSGLQIQ
jgi:hypothetical protein